LRAQVTPIRLGVRIAFFMAPNNVLVAREFVFLRQDIIGVVISDLEIRGEYNYTAAYLGKILRLFARASTGLRFT
jgi:hypothetical protein